MEGFRRAPIKGLSANGELSRLFRQPTHASFTINTERSRSILAVLPVSRSCCLKPPFLFGFDIQLKLEASPWSYVSALSSGEKERALSATSPWLLIFALAALRLAAKVSAMMAVRYAVETGVEDMLEVFQTVFRKDIFVGGSTKLPVCPGEL